MKLNVKAVAVTAAFIWGVLAMFLVGLANLAWPEYGKAFLELMASLYPGYKAAASFWQVIVGMLYGMVDGAVCGALFALIYNCLAGVCCKQPETV